MLLRVCPQGLHRVTSAKNVTCYSDTACREYNEKFVSPYNDDLYNDDPYNDDPYNDDPYNDDPYNDDPYNDNRAREIMNFLLNFAVPA